MKVLFFVLIIVPSALLGQQAPPDISGSWQAEMLDGPQTIVVQGDSTVSFGDESVRFRISADTIYVLFGDEWVGYNFEVHGDTLRLSGGDLEDPVFLTRVGPSSRRHILFRVRYAPKRGGDACWG